MTYSITSHGSKTKFTIACLALPGVQASALFGALEMLANAERCRHSDGPAITAMIVSPDGHPVPTAAGHMVEAETALPHPAQIDAIYIPPMLVHDYPEAGAEVSAWLRACAAQGALIATAGNAAHVLGQAGLLRGASYTAGHADFARLRPLYPEATLDDGKSLCASGPGHRLITAGAGTLWIDLSLYLVFRLLGLAAAERLARLHMVDWSLDTSLPDLTLDATLHHADYRIRQAQIEVIKHYCEADILTMAREAAGLPVRTFERRFKAATGMSCVKFIQAVRVERAKQMLSDSGEVVDSVSERVGYADPASFRRLFGKLVGLSPSQYRLRNQAA